LFLLTLFAFVCLGQIDPNSLVPIPGMDLLGWGFDIRSGPQIEYAIKAPLFDFPYDEVPVTYTYPLWPNLTFKVPSNVFVSTSSRVSTNSYVTTNITQEIFNLGLSLGLSGTVDGTNNTQFTGDLNLNYQRRLLTSGNYVIGNNQIAIGLWTVAIGPLAPITELFNQSVANLGLYQSTDSLTPLQFVDSYGTHFISGVMVGGMIAQSTNIQNSNASTTDQLGFLAQGEFKNFFGIDDAKFDINANLTEQRQEFIQNTYYTMQSNGGSYSVTNFFQGNTNPSETYQTWLNSLKVNPVSVLFRLTPIVNLIADPDVYTSVSNAVVNYINGQDAFDYAELDIFSTPSPSP